MPRVKKKSRLTEGDGDVGRVSDGAIPLMKVPVFASDDYRHYLRAVLDANVGRRGLRSELSRAAKCSPSFLTQVLSDEAALSFDHVIGIAHYLEMSDPEITYLRELLIQEKCATKVARDDSARRAAAMRRERGDGVIVGVSPSTADGRKVAEVMSSLPHWDVFGLLGAPNDSTPDRIAVRLSLEPARVRQILDDMREAGLVEPIGGGQWRCSGAAGSIFKQSRGMAKMTNVMQKLRMLSKLVQDEIDPPRSAFLRIKASDMDDIKRRCAEVFEFAWQRSAERELTGDSLVYLSFEIDRIC